MLLTIASSFSYAFFFVVSRHPGQLSDVLAHGVLNALDHLQRALFALCPEGAIDIKFAERHAEAFVRRLHALFQRGPISRCPDIFAIKFENFVDRSLRQLGSVIVDRFPAQVGLPVAERDYRVAVHLLEKIRLPTFSEVKLGRAIIREIKRQSKFGAVSAISAVVILWSAVLRIAPRRAVHRSLRQPVSTASTVLASAAAASGLSPASSNIFCTCSRTSAASPPTSDHP